MFFSLAKRSKIKDDNPDESFGEIRKLLRLAWTELSDDTKAEWEEKADQDKIRYKNEMDEYSAPSDDNDRNDNNGDDDETGHPGRKARGKYKTFNERIDDLMRYKEIHGNTNVTKSEDKSLA